MKLTDLQKSQLRNLLGSPQWRIVAYIAEELIKNIQKNSSIADTEWETLRTTVDKEGKVKGIREFFQEVMKQIE